MNDLLKTIITKPEGKTLEFKRDSASPTLLMKTLVAFANTSGGRLIIGVSNERQIVGLKTPLDEDEKLRILITDSIAPLLVPQIELITVQETTILAIEVQVSASRPHWLKSEGREQGTYLRIGTTNLQADKALIAEIGRSAEDISFDELPIPELSKDDLDLVAVQKFFAGVRELNSQSLLSMKLLTAYQRRLVPTRGAVLLFGKERELHFSDAWIQCVRFNGTDKAVIFDHIDIHDHLPLAVETIMQFLYKYTRQVPAIPLTSIREAVINALMHTDYSQHGAPIYVSIFDNRIEIENPGTLMPGMTLESMKQGRSRIRNHVIARIFNELNLIERWGSGIESLFREAEALQLPEPQIMEIGIRIRITVYFAAPLSVFASNAQEKEYRTLHKRQIDNDDWRQENELIEREKKAQASALHKAQEIVHMRGDVDTQILAACLNAPLSSAEIASALGHKQLSGNLRKALPRLREAGLLAYTIPESHNSRLQKYRLTKKGTALYIAKVQVMAQDQTVENEQTAPYKRVQDDLFFEAQVYSTILSACAVLPLSSAEIATSLGRKQSSASLRKALPYLISAGLLQYTIPEKPNSRLQKYHLTAKGRRLMNKKRI
ncbi:MAG: AAA family ATPase [Chlorobiaceae bacterium]|nr:AAA family ATPase [Chlorobiaceae bacterium]NTV15847.1 AAA family ATPase [Chlorobiaceae bacterium]